MLIFCFLVGTNAAAARPRVGAQQSIPGLLNTFQNEWDALVLECFNLKQQLHGTKQELSRALYHHDAATRVIARLLKERDQYKSYAEMFMLSRLHSHPSTRLQRVGGSSRSSHSRRCAWRGHYGR